MRNEGEKVEKNAGKDGEAMECHENWQSNYWDISRANTEREEEMTDQHTCDLLADLTRNGTFDYGVEDSAGEGPPEMRRGEMEG